MFNNIKKKMMNAKDWILNPNQQDGFNLHSLMKH